MSVFGDVLDGLANKLNVNTNTYQSSTVQYMANFAHTHTVASTYCICTPMQQAQKKHRHVNKQTHTGTDAQADILHTWT